MSEQRDIAKAETQHHPVSRYKVCSPIYRCFPPSPTRCAICGNTTPEQCPLDRERS